MADKVSEMFPDSGQLTLAHGGTSGLVAFKVDSTVSPWFLQVLAVGPKCRPLRGKAPDIELQAGNGLITAVPQAPAEVVVPDESGTPAGTASWTRDVTDVFTVRLEIAEPGTSDWSVRITNNDPQELGFVWTSAGSIEDGRKPRVQMDTSVHVTVRGTAPDHVEVPVANIGPGTLTFGGSADVDMGAGFVLHSFPDSLAPNSCGQLVLQVTSGGRFAASTRTASFTLNCNNPAKEEATLHLTRDQEKDGKDSKERKDKDGKESKEKEHKDFTSKELERSANPLPGFMPGPGLQHFIPAYQRPHLADSALGNEDLGAGPSSR